MPISEYDGVSRRLCDVANALRGKCSFGKDSKGMVSLVGEGSLCVVRLCSVLAETSALPPFRLPILQAGSRRRTAPTISSLASPLRPH
jgi:hypothetical protein